MYTTATPGTFQLSTDELFPAAAQGNGSVSTTFQIGTENVRIDGSGPRTMPHFRAVQLADFTVWLQQQRANSEEAIAVSSPMDSAIQDPARIDPQTQGAVNKVAGITTGRFFRVDPPQTHQLHGSLPRPNFETANYVDPAARRSTRNEPTQFASESASNDVQNTIQRLKADGRIIGDLHQAALPVDRGLLIPAFKWPLVTSSLLGSPAILNLETNVRNFLSHELNQILITTARRGDGATTVAIALARQLAAGGSRVLLIDADIANPMLAHRMGLVHQKSWIQTISNRSAANDLLVTQNATPISLLPLSPIASKVGWPRKIYDQFSGMANQLSRHFDVVLIDVGPVSQLIDESSSPKIRTAATLLVAGQNSNSVVDSQRAKAGLLSFGIEEMLIIQNFSRLRTAAPAKVG